MVRVRAQAAGSVQELYELNELRSLQLELHALRTNAAAARLQCSWCCKVQRELNELAVLAGRAHAAGQIQRLAKDSMRRRQRQETAFAIKQAKSEVASAVLRIQCAARRRRATAARERIAQYHGLHDELALGAARRLRRICTPRNRACAASLLLR